MNVLSSPVSSASASRDRVSPSSALPARAQQRRWLQDLDLRGLQLPPVDAPDAVDKPLFRLGYGACAKSGCGCRHFEGSDSRCSNGRCGHALGDHW